MAMEMQLKRVDHITNAYKNFGKLGQAKMTAGACYARTEQLKVLWRDFEEAHRKLSDDPAVDFEEKYFKSDAYSTTYDAYLNNLGLFHDFLLKLENANVAPATTRDGAAGDSVRADMDTNRAKLPQIVIGDFSGDIQDWVRFRDTFKEMVIDRPNLANIFKMNYLRTYVRGEAAELLQEVPSGGEHFATAWRVLLSHYDNRRLLINKLLTKLMSLTPMSNDSATELMRVLNGVRNLLQALKALGSPVNQWDHFTVFLTRSKIMLKCQTKWEVVVKQSDDPTVPDTFESLCKFLEAERNALSLLETTKDFTKKTLHTSSESKASTSKSRKSSNFVQAGSSQAPCPVCSEDHDIELCTIFRKQSVNERKRTLGQKRLCYRCLEAHMMKNCKSSLTCFNCNGKHHTLIHTLLKKSGGKSATSKQAPNDLPTIDESSNSMQSVMAAVSSKVQGERLEALLATARIRVSAPQGQFTTVRALVDQCAQSSFVTEELCQRLRLKKRQVNVPISGIGRGRDNTRAEVEVSIGPHFRSSFKLTFKAYVLPSISNYQPCCKDHKEWTHISGLQLSDPYFATPGRIDVLLGTQIHARVIEEGLIKGGDNYPVAMKTQLGWMLSGSDEKPTQDGTVVCLQTDDHMSEQLKSFWKIEEPPHVIPWSDEDKLCRKNTVRLPDGRYQVKLPLRADAPTDWLNSRQIARSCLLSLKRKLTKNPLLYAEYKASIEQMIKADQMRKVEIQPQSYGSHYFLPHHAVVKDSSTTTRVRPVLNASARNSAGHSLNEHLMTGPNLLPQIALTLAHWRSYPIAFVADVSKMYLQVRLHPDDWRLQTLLWRDDPHKEIENYVLTTVTFGSGPSAFLANRTLRQLAEDEGEKYPLATPIVRREMYMDDVLSGASDIKLAMQKRDQLNALFSAGGFTLAKWMTNDDQMLRSFGSDSLAKESTLKVGLGFSVLGLVWEPRTDVFQFNVSLEPLTSPITKRKLLSCIAGMFDPSGWIAPVLISLKIFMQALWLLTKEWDSPLPVSEVERWRAFEDDLRELSTIAIPRWTGILSDAYLELHGFADASKFAYAAVLYVRVLYHGQARVTLFASKTKVAPLKTLSIPRLELCAAHLLAKLASSFITTEDFARVPLYLWSDSKTTLHWIQGIPARWPVFVANRCADIVQLTPRATWQYINTKQNPADLASRGSTVSTLRDNKLWWHRPEALVATSQPWTVTNFDNSNEAAAEIEMTERVALLQEVTPPLECEIIARFSSYTRMRRVLVYCLRFVKKLALKCNIKLSLQFELSTGEEITVDELACVTTQLCRMTQASYFSKEMFLVKSGQRLHKGHCLGKLCPKIENGLLRVGGRLHNSLLSDDCKHPIILPTKSRLTTLLIDHMHKVTMYGGAQLIGSHLRQQYWIPRLKIMISAKLRKCVVCLRYRAATASQRMADLPAVRVTPDRLFKSSGIDHAGPFMLKASRHRGSLSYKGYMAIFICMVTKAVHLEAVSSYDTASFIAALKRFVSRRGQCLHIYSDCGTNFVGADAQLRQMHRKGSAFYKSIFSHLSGEGITWHYNPPGSPHFGGLWESGVKSVKHHLKRMIGDTLLTYEEFATLLAQIEAILNSRPLTPLSEEPEPEAVLTPAHPIIGESSFLIDEPPVRDERIGALERWKSTCIRCKNAINGNKHSRISSSAI